MLVLLAVLALPAAIPAAASATITPSLVLAPSTVSAGATQSLGFDLAFSPSPGDYPTAVSLALPAGLLLDLNGGACLSSATPAAGCELGTGTQTTTTSAPVSLWLVKGPTAADAAGAALVAGTSAGTPEATADITVRTTPSVGEDLSFATLPTGLSALSLTLTTVRAPTSCPSTPATVAVSATPAMPPTTPQSASAALTVTGCSSLSYAPKLAATVDKDASDSGATFTATVTAPTTDSASQALSFVVPASVSPSVSAALGCVLGSPCPVGSAAASSPFLASSALANGTVTLGGSVATPTLTVTFPAPYPISLTGTISLSSETLTFSNVPDLPLAVLAIQIGGPSTTQLFTTTCAASSLTAKLTPWDGAATQSISTPITFGGSCPPPTGTTSPPPTTKPAKPTASGASLGGLVKHKTKLAFTAKQDKSAKPIKRIAVTLPKGLSFSSKGKNLAKGIAVRNSHGKKVKFTAKVSHGVLTITLSAATSEAQITLASPAISVSSKLAKSVAKGLAKKKVSKLKISLKLTDSSGKATTVALDLKPKS